MNYSENDLRLDLQLCAEGADGAGAGEGPGVTGTAAVSQETGVNVTPSQGEQGQAAAAEQQKPDRNAEFEKLIKGEYKDLYEARVRNTVQQRLKGTREITDRYEALSPVLDMLAVKYGVKADDVAGLSRAIEADDAFYEEEAMATGMSVEQVRQMRKIQRENAVLRRQADAQTARENANKQYAAWIDQAEAAKAVYPNLDLQEEIQNPAFVDLLKSNIDVGTAYKVIHMDDILHGAMQYTAQTVGQKLANNIIANGARPAENGTGAQAPARTRVDVSKLSDKEMDEYLKKIARGEKVDFSQ